MELVERLRTAYSTTFERSLAKEAADKIEALQAKIDMLMWEYCPEEMTEEQKQEWERHQINIEKKKSIFEQNPHLKNKKSYEESLQKSVESSTAIEKGREKKNDCI